MKTGKALLIVLLVIGAFVALAILAGCTVNPLRVFQASVPAPILKPVKQLEAERRSADLIARKIEAPAELKPVAVALSASLGAPQEQIKADTPAELPRAADAAIAELTAATLAMQRQIVELNKSLVKYQGKEIEGTGFSLLGPGMTAIVIGLIVLAVACPPALALMGFAYRRLKATAKIVVNEVEEAANAPETREAMATLKSKVRAKMGESPLNTAKLKATILDLKKS